MVSMSAPSGIRIGNDERDAAIKALDEHMSAGRLDPDEYGQRVAEASVARTRDDLTPLFADLPQPHPFAPAPPRRNTPSAAAVLFFVVLPALGCGGWRGARYRGRLGRRW